MKPPPHVPVMVQEVIHWLAPEKGGIYVDCTLGCGGHTLAILESTGGKVKVVGIDRDEKTLEVAREHLEGYGEKLNLLRANFTEIDKVLKDKGIDKVDGILFDLGLSSFQLDDPDRGLSFRYDAPLDMRMDKQQELTAAQIVNRSPEEELAQIIRKLGEERWAKRMAKFIVREREEHPIITTKQLVDTLKRAVPAKFRRGRRIHFATRVFQALRIAVNDELNNLRIGLEKAIHQLLEGGRVCVISYHSLEDRIVKRKFKQAEGKELKLLTSSVVRPSKGETKDNPRARSARLRAAQRI